MKMQGKRGFKSTVHGPLSTVLLILLISTIAQAKSDWAYYLQSGHTSAKWDSLVEAGFDTFEGGSLDTAQNFLQRAGALGCQDALVQLKLAQIIEAKGNLKGSLEIYLRLKPVLEEKYPKHPQAKAMAEQVGRLYFGLEQYDKALPFLLEAIQKQGENFLRLFLAGQICRMQEKRAEAIGYFEKALTHKVPPGSPPQMILLASLELMRLYFATEQFEKALETAHAVLETDPANAEAQNIRDQIRRAKYKEEEKKTWERILNR